MCIMRLTPKVGWPWLIVLLAFLPFSCCEQPVNCRWGSYGEWSECDGCTKTQVQTRPIEVFAQYGGSPCSGESSRRQDCVPTKPCPLESGCGERFRCSSGQCLSTSLVCNGDQDCEEDGLDEQQCDESHSTSVCDLHKTPPNADLTGKGFDILTGQFRADVINTRSFGGQCIKVSSGDHKDIYRLPQSLLKYTFQVAVENDFSEEAYESSWSYLKHTEEKTPIRGGHDHRTFHTELNKDKSHRLMIIKNQVELAQFQNIPPEYATLAESFWKAIRSLPVKYDSAAYRFLLQTYGTHVMSEGSLGGQYHALLEFDSEALKETSTTDIDFHQCITHVKRRLFWKKRTTKCEKLIQSLKSVKGYSHSKLPIKTDIIGGHVSFVAGLSLLDLENPDTNSQMYTKWAGSVKDFPQVINHKLRPLYELLKEVQCVGIKKLHLRRAIEEYLEEEHPCHCRPCHQNGQPLLLGSTCSCVCRPGTSGTSCQHGAVIGEQPGVLHGSWSCWSAWAPCSQGQRSRVRTCTNPSPRNGGRFCVGQPKEHKPCNEPDLQHLQMMEPHCFDLSLPAPKLCGAPPFLRNGFIMNQKDVYPVGSKVEYTCMTDYYITAEAVAECTENQTWTRAPMECSRVVCGAPSLPSDVRAAPLKQAYTIGESVSLSCPTGMEKEGPPEIVCSSSLDWSPSPEALRCRARSPVLMDLPVRVGVQCKAWETLEKGQCVCKLPNQCEKPSFQLCASLQPGKTNRLGVCQLGALECLGRSYTLAQDSACDWPKKEFTSCQDCLKWEKCDASATMCECKAPEECLEDSTLLCVKPGKDGIAMTMTECEVGAKRCQGLEVTVVNIGACQA